MRRQILAAWAFVLMSAACPGLQAQTAAPGLHPSPAATEGLRLLYSGDPDAAIEQFRQVQTDSHGDPLGYLLEAEGRWWKIFCESAEFKWGMTDAWHRNKQAGDQAYLALADKAIALAEEHLKQADSAGARLDAGLGYLLKARLYALRDEKRAAAREGVRAREHLLRALELDPSLADADIGLGLYNYYVDTLSGIAKVLRFFMGIPGGSKKDGLRQLQRAAEHGTFTAAEARFYLAKNLRNFDRDYGQALQVLEPLAAQYPSNAIFQLFLGDLHAKLNHKEQAAAYYRAAAALPVPDAACRARIHALSAAALASLGPAYALAPAVP
jgi:tetratricopeptide (TPR) repeat protein